MITKLALGLVLLFMSAHAFADLKSKIATCAANADDTERLACFDALAHRLDAERPKVTSSQGAGGWQIATETSPIYNRTNVYHCSVNSPKKIHSDYNTVYPMLMILCAQNKTRVSIDWGLYLGLDSNRLLMRLDKENPHTSAWNMSTNSGAVFANSSVTFAKELMKRNKLLAQIMLYGETPIMAVFDIRSLSKAINYFEKHAIGSDN